MAAIFTYADEYRHGKGQRTVKGFRQQFGQGGGKFIKTPDSIALRRLNKILKDTEGVDGRTRNVMFRKVEGAEHLRFMNMKVMARVLLYLNSVNWNVTQNDFNYATLSPFIEKLLPSHRKGYNDAEARKYSEAELDVIRLRLAATFMRYVMFINQFQLGLGRKLDDAVTQVPTAEENEIYAFHKDK